jgi:lysozyme
MGDYISPAMATSLMEAELAWIAWILSFRIPGWCEMKASQQAALLDFAYNLGTDFYGADDFGTISRALAAKNWAAVPGAMLLYSDPGAPTHEGELARRQAEADMWAR